MKTDYAYYSSPGGRSNNEDSVSVKDLGGKLAAVVADGLGGHASGEIASMLAVEAVNSGLEGLPFSEDSAEKAVEAANLAVINDSRSDSMKTTIALAWLGARTALFATVGDTRIYHFRNDEIIFRSVDHSVSQISVMSGEITPDQIRGHKDRNKLVRVLGNRPGVRANILSANLREGDALLLCSDGFWENIVESEMTEALKHAATARKWLSDMLRIVRKNAPADCDNNSAIAVFIGREA